MSVKPIGNYIVKYYLEDSHFTKVMEHLLEESVSSADLKRFETRYHEEMAAGKITPSAQFEYAWCLVRSKYPADIRKGILLLEDLYQVSLKTRILGNFPRISLVK